MIEVSASRLVVWLLLSFLGGVFVSSFFWFGQSFLFLPLILGIGLIVVSFVIKNKEVSVFGFLFLSFVFGVWRFQTVNLSLERPDLEKFSDQNVRMIGYVADDPKIRLALSGPKPRFGSRV
jgi:hypothetical protein